MAKIPEIKNVKFKDIYGDDNEAVLIPLSSKANYDIEETIEKIKNNFHLSRQDKIQIANDTIKVQTTAEEEIADAYVEAKVISDLTKLQEEYNDDRVKKLKEQRKEKLLDGKTTEVMIKELAIMGVDMSERGKLLTKSLSVTLWHMLRKKDDRKVNYYETLEDLESSLSQDMIFELFIGKVDDAKTSDEDLKN